MRPSVGVFLILSCGSWEDDMTLEASLIIHIKFLTVRTMQKYFILFQTSIKCFIHVQYACKFRVQSIIPSLYINEQELVSTKYSVTKYKWDCIFQHIFLLQLVILCIQRHTTQHLLIHFVTLMQCLTHVAWHFGTLWERTAHTSRFTLFQHIQSLDSMEQALSGYAQEYSALSGTWAKSWSQLG